MQCILFGQLRCLFAVHGAPEGVQLELSASGVQPCRHWLSTAVILRAPMQTLSADLQHQRRHCRYIMQSKQVTCLSVNNV